MLWLGEGNGGRKEGRGFVLWATQFSEQPAREITRPMIKNNRIVQASVKGTVQIEAASGSSRWKEAAQGSLVGHAPSARHGPHALAPFHATIRESRILSLVEVDVITNAAQGQVTEAASACCTCICL